MAYADTLGQILRVTEAFLYPPETPGQQVQECNVNFVCVSSGGGDSRLALGVAVDATWQAGLSSKMATNTTMYGAKVSAIGLHPPPMAQIALNPNAGTAAATGFLPTQARGLIQWRTLVGGRTGRGRVFGFTPYAGEIKPNGDPSTSYQAALLSVANTLLAGFTVGGSTWRVCIAHRTPAVPFPTYTFDLVTSTAVRTFWCTQRRSGESGRVNATPF